MIVEPAKSRSCFLHVPKSGGTALTLYLRGVLGKRNVFHVGEGRYQKAPLEGLMKRYPVITGHFNVAQIPERLFQTTFFFTFLREPADRIVSMYHFFKEGDMDSDHRVVIGEEWCLERALDKWARPGRCSSWSNEQTFLFSGATDAEQPPEELLPLAMRNLERFDFVGVHERFAEGVECLGHLRDWPLQAPVPRFKTSRKRLAVDEVKPALVKRILEANHCDVQLYARALELWDAVRTRADAIPAAPADAGREIFSDRPLELPGEPASLSPAVEPPLSRVEKGSQEIRFSGVDVFDLRTNGDAVVQFGHPTEVRLGIYSTVDAGDIHVGLRIADETDMEVYSSNTQLRGRALAVEMGTVTTVRWSFGMSLAPGAYHLSVMIQGGATHDRKLFHKIDNVALFWCVNERPAKFTGLVDLRAGLRVANPYVLGGSWWEQLPRPLRVGLRCVKNKLGLPWRPPKLVRYIVRTIRNEGWRAIKFFVTGTPPPKRDARP